MVDGLRRKDVKSRGQGLGNRRTPPQEWNLDKATEIFTVQLPMWESEGNRTDAQLGRKSSSREHYRYPDHSQSQLRKIRVHTELSKNRYPD